MSTIDSSTPRHRTLAVHIMSNTALTGRTSGVDRGQQLVG
jgi:hypothetical protein